MSDHQHGHSHPHPHGEAGVPPHVDPEVPDGDLDRVGLGRRRFLQAAGLLGGGTVGSTALAGTAAATTAASTPAGAGSRGGRGSRGLSWLAGDHHIHTQFSPDGFYTVGQQVEQSRRFGLDWLVITDHGGPQHVNIGVVRTQPEIARARASNPDVLVFQGFEWNIPASEHGTVFITPPRRAGDEVAVLQEFERAFDGTVRSASASTEANERLAVEGIRWLGQQVRDRRVGGALFLGNHPSRRGVVSPHELRNWRDADPSVAIGYEGAPGHQAAAIPASQGGAGQGRGFYDNEPSADSFPGYVFPDDYVTYGGYDPMTARLGGVWDSLLSEGKLWTITNNSDNHATYRDPFTRGPGSDFAANGQYEDPVDSGAPITGRGDFWPGYYARTHVGAEGRDYASVVDGLRAGRVWVDHGSLLRALDANAFGRDQGRAATFGGRLSVRAGEDVTVVVSMVLPQGTNFSGDVPGLARVDLISGQVIGPVTDLDTRTAPQTAVVRSFEIDARQEVVEVSHTFRDVRGPFYVRLRGTDGNHSAPGSIEPRVDPLGDSSPFDDLWFYSNPIFVDVEGR